VQKLRYTRKGLQALYLSYCLLSFFVMFIVNERL
jgi:hypothetical protein